MSRVQCMMELGLQVGGKRSSPALPLWAIPSSLWASVSHFIKRERLALPRGTCLPQGMLGGLDGN